MAKRTVHLVETATEIQRESWGEPTGRIFRDYNVECREGDRRWTVGRLSGSAGAWIALPIAGTAWSRWHRTRAAALHALELRENCLLPDTYVLQP